MPFENSLNLLGMLLYVSGALASRALSYTFCRMTACGQTMTHLPHWMHRSDSQTGMSRVMLRFSHCVVPVGKEPSAGMALTGTSSPSKTSIGAMTLRTKSGELAGTAARRVILDVALAGTLTSNRFSMVASTAA